VTDDRLEELLWRMDHVAADERAPDWERRFAQAMQKLGRRRGWRPTKRQRDVMESIVTDRLGGRRQLELVEE
jgi:hypothetical protein